MEFNQTRLPDSHLTVWPGKGARLDIGQSSKRLDMSHTAERGRRVPAPWAPHKRCWIAWPANQDTFRGVVEDAQKAYADFANSLSEFEPVVMVVDPAEKENAQKYLSRDIEIISWPLDDAWMRDIAPTFVLEKNSESMLAVNWGFNDYGDKDGRGWRGYCNDAEITRRIAKRLSLDLIVPPLVCEGGALVSDGQGTLITTESVICNPNRNPGMTKEKAESILREALGATQVIWLPQGLVDDDTDGHADNLVAFFRPARAFVTSEEDHSDANFPVLQHTIEILQNSRDAFGRKLELIRLPQPPPHCRNDHRLSLSYANFYMSNGAIWVPEYGHIKSDEYAKAIIKEHAHDRMVKGVPSLAIALGGGSLHCITHEEPLV